MTNVIHLARKNKGTRSSSIQDIVDYVQARVSADKTEALLVIEFSREAPEAPLTPQFSYSSLSELESNSILALLGSLEVLKSNILGMLEPRSNDD